MSDLRLIAELGAEARRIEEDSNYSAKSHFNAASGWGQINLALGIPATILSGLSAASVKTYPSAAGTASIIAALLTGLMTFLKPSDRATKHKDAAGQYLALKNQARMFRNVDLVHAQDNHAASKRLKELAGQRDRLNQSSPVIPGWAFRKARTGIVAGEADHEVDRKEEM